MSEHLHLQPPAQPVTLPHDIVELVKKAATAEQLKTVLELVSTTLSQVGLGDAARVNLSRALGQL
jgi:hypothetical protein